MTGMKPFKLQQTYLWQIQQLWFLLMVTIPCICAYRENDGDKTYNLKIGFDLTRGAQGASALRIRNYEENEDAENFQPALRAELPTSGSTSAEDRNVEKKKEVLKVEMKAAEDSAQSVESDDSGVDSKRSTKGLRADEFEPQGPEVREEFDEESDSANSN